MIIANLFDASETLGLSKGKRFGVIILGFGMTIFEAAAVLMMVPVLEFVQAKGQLSANTLQSFRWKALTEIFAVLGTPVSLGGLLLIAFAAILIRQAMQYSQRVFTSKARYELVAHIRSKLFGAVLGADLATIETEATGRLVNDFTTESDTAVSAIFFTLQIVVLTLICGVYLCSLIALSSTMTALSVALMALLAIMSRGFLRQTHALGQATMEANQDVGAFLVERLKSLRLIRLSGTEIAEQKHVRRLLAEQSSLRIAGDKNVSKLSAAIEPSAMGFAFFCLWFGSTYLGLGVETLGVFLVILLRLVPIGKDLINARQIAIQAQASLDWVIKRLRVFDLARETDSGQQIFKFPARSIVFDNVQYHHGSGDARVNALNGISLAIPAGKTTALVGPSGGGKSTLIDLLPKLRKPQDGRILIDEIPLDEFDLESLRNGIAFVPQAAQIFDVTPSEHIRYGRPDATSSDIENAARSANAFDFLSRLPNGFDTPLGEGGGRLSGGQRQRLDLARAIARRAPILVLDEPTSALDAESENEFHAALDALARKGDTTIVIIAHRLSTVAHADQIVVIEAGRITNTGTHDTLMADGGWYAQSWALQTRGQASEGSDMPLIFETERD